nr:hypothetical protein [Tanacetum cinerariifolium]
MRNYGANKASDTQDSQEHKKKHHDLSICRVRRFKMIKYSFDADDKYVAIKEHEHFDHLRPNIDAYIPYDISKPRRMDVIVFNFCILISTTLKHLLLEDAKWRILRNCTFRLLSFYARPCCNKIDELVMVYSGKDLCWTHTGILTPLQHTFDQELKLENNLEQNIRGVM